MNRALCLSVSVRFLYMLCVGSLPYIVKPQSSTRPYLMGIKLHIKTLPSHLSAQPRYNSSLIKATGQAQAVH